MRAPSLPTALALATLLLGFAAAPTAATPPGQTIQVPGLVAPVTVVTDPDGVPHITAQNDFDLARVSGYIHARDRFFQMDLLRREISGDIAEVLGASFIGQDIQNRTVGLRRAAERTVPTLPPRVASLLQAYADGVNAYLAANPLPPEYADLELTSVRPWDVVDIVTLGKGLAANLSLDIDVGPTLQLAEYVQAGLSGGFDGEALFFEDVRRSAPMDPASTVPDAGGPPTYAAKRPKLDPAFLARVAKGARKAQERMSASPLLAKAMQRREFQIGSNEWGVSGAHAKGGLPIMANDPHLSLDIPATFYEWHLRVVNDPDEGPGNASGVSFPGAPGVILGQNEDISWGATTNGLDVTDIFEDEAFLLQPECDAIGAIACIRTDGVVHPVDIQLGVVYRANNPSDSILDNVDPVPLSLQDSVIVTVPFRSFGPVISIDGITLPIPGTGTVLVLQYTGFHATHEIETFLTWLRASNMADFEAGLANFDVGSQNWSYVDRQGNLAYYSSAESPLRADLEAGTVNGLPPGFIRQGSGGNWVPDPARSQGQAIPFAVLPDSERPRLINPPWFVNANNDPAGTTLDNDPVNQTRLSNPGAIYYLSGSYANGLRAGRITRLIQDKVDRGKKISVDDMKRFQANTQQLDAELLTPFLLSAFDNADSGGAPPELALFADDNEVIEAIGRLEDWDFSTPTGIEKGYDAADRDGVLSSGKKKVQRKKKVKFKKAKKSKKNVKKGKNKKKSKKLKRDEKNSVAATIYNVWRAKLLNLTIDDTLNGLGVSNVGSSDAVKAIYNLLNQSPFTGVGASGVDFFPNPASLAAAGERRDVILLQALRDALDALASNDFAQAFGNSTDQRDYRWGKLHRITFDHPLGGAYSIPPAAGFMDLAPGLPGIPRDGGYEVVNASGFSARADAENEFRFGGGPNRRYVGVGGYPVLGGGHIRGFNVVPGGPSGDPSSPDYATQLGVWLTSDYHEVSMDASAPLGGIVRQDSYIP